MTAVLLELDRRRGDLVTKRELFAAVWPDIAVSDDVLWRCISRLRGALEDDPKTPRWIETLPRRGYRLAPPAPSGASSRKANRGRERRISALTSGGLGGWPARTVAAAACVAAVIAAGTATSRWAQPPDSERATVLAAGDPHDWNAAAFVNLAREAYESRSHDDVLRAVQLYGQAIDRDARSAPAWAGLADAQSGLVSWHGAGLDIARQALASAEHAIRLDSGLAGAHKALGFARAVNGDPEGAASAYVRALELQPDYLDAANNLAIIHQAFGRYELAVELFASLPARPAEQAVVLGNLGEALLQLGAYDRAAELLAQAVEINPLTDATIEALVRVELLRGDPALAAARAQEALRTAPDSPVLLNAAADVAMVRGRWAEAQEWLARSIELSAPRRNVAARVRRVWLARRAGDERAELPWPIELFERAAARTASWKSAYRVAEAHAAAGAPGKAAEWLHEAARRGFVDIGWLALDPLFAQTRREPSVRALLEEQQSGWSESRHRALAVLEPAAN